MPGAMAESPTGTLMLFIADTKTFIPPITTSSDTTRGFGVAEQTWPSQLTARPISVAARRDISRSGLPLSTHPRTRLVDPSGSGRWTSMTMRLWSRVMGTVTDLGVTEAVCARRMPGRRTHTRREKTGFITENHLITEDTQGAEGLIGK